MQSKKNVKVPLFQEIFFFYFSKKGGNCSVNEKFLSNCHLYDELEMRAFFIQNK
jgi:hypothetical protein